MARNCNRKTPRTHRAHHFHLLPMEFFFFSLSQGICINLVFYFRRIRRISIRFVSFTWWVDFSLVCFYFFQCQKRAILTKKIHHSTDIYFNIVCAYCIFLITEYDWYEEKNCVLDNSTHSSWTFLFSFSFCRKDFHFVFMRKKYGYIFHFRPLLEINGNNAWNLHGYFRSNNFRVQIPCICFAQVDDVYFIAIWYRKRGMSLFAIKVEHIFLLNSFSKHTSSIANIRSHFHWSLRGTTT